MKLTFIGSGSGFCNHKTNYHSNILVESINGKNLLIDCGSDARHSLANINCSFNEIDNVFISHLHSDHIGGLEWLGFSRLYDKGGDLSHLFIPKLLITPLWENCLKGGMNSFKEKEAQLDDFFQVHPVDESFIWEKIKFTLIKTIHVYSNHKLLPSYGLFIESGKSKILFTGDTCFTPEIFSKFYQQADIIFHDCETSAKKSGVHSNFADLKNLPAKIKMKTWLYHANDPQAVSAKEQGFLGIVKKAQVFSDL
jgi:ribonuclease BN (tRNA processing enzyme)